MCRLAYIGNLRIFSNEHVDTLNRIRRNIRNWSGCHQTLMNVKRQKSHGGRGFKGRASFFESFLELSGLFLGGEGGIRTHGTLARTPDFESGTFDHSATSPGSKTKRAFPKAGDCSRSLTMRVSPRLSAPMLALDAQGVSTFTPPMYGHNASGTVMLPSDCW